LLGVVLIIGPKVKLQLNYISLIDKQLFLLENIVAETSIIIKNKLNYITIKL